MRISWKKLVQGSTNDRALIAGKSSTGDDKLLHELDCFFFPAKPLSSHSLLFSRNDGVIMGFAMFFFTAMYALIRYDKSMSGSEPHANIPMYLVDKAIAWTALWMMVVSPFAGNLLALYSNYQKWSNIGYLQKIVRHAHIYVPV